MAEKKTKAPPEKNQRVCRYCKLVFSELNEYVQQLDNNGYIEECIKRELKTRGTKYLEDRKMYSCKVYCPSDSAGSSASSSAERKRSGKLCMCMSCLQKYKKRADFLLKLKKGEVKKREEHMPITKVKMLQPEETEKCVSELQSWNISTERAKLLNRDDMVTLLEMMMKMYPKMVAVQSGYIGDGLDFDICCTECPVSFNDLESAQQHFKEDIHG